jgi:hypothetical protein
VFSPGPKVTLWLACALCRYESMERDEHGKFKREKAVKVHDGRLGPPTAWLPQDEAAIAARVRVPVCSKL